MNLNASQINDLLNDIEWEEKQEIRLFWIKIRDDSRSLIAKELVELDSKYVILPLVLRETLFISSNAVLADFIKLIEINKSEFDKLSLKANEKLTIVLLLKDDFNLAQISSPVNLPRWFPINGGSEVFLKIKNLIQTAEVGLLHCPEAKIETLSELIYEMEHLLSQRLKYIIEHKIDDSYSIIDILYEEDKPKPDEVLCLFEQFLISVEDPKAYRINAMRKNSIISLFLHKIIKSSPDKLASFSSKISVKFNDLSDELLKPTLFSIMLRPTNKITPAARNWHAILLSCYQVYQLSNAAAHAGEYPAYPINLIYSNSYDLVRFLNDANLYLAKLNEQYF